MRKRVGREIEHNVDMPCNQIADRCARSAIGNDAKTRSGLLLEEKSGDVSQAPGAAASLRGAVRFALEPRYQAPKVVRRHILSRYDQQLGGSNQGDRSKIENIVR